MTTHYSTSNTTTQLTLLHNSHYYTTHTALVEVEVVPHITVVVVKVIHSTYDHTTTPH